MDDKAAALAGAAAHIGRLAAQAPVRTSTNFRLAGKGQWLGTVSTETLTLTFYRVSDKRGAIAQASIGLTGAAHAYCNARHLRELEALIEIDQEPWAKDMSEVLVEPTRRRERRGKRARPPWPPPRSRVSWAPIGRPSGPVG